MKKGLEIAFQPLDNEHSDEIVRALADLTGNAISEKMPLRWQIFHVTLDDQKYYRVLYLRPDDKKLGRRLKIVIRENFDSFAHMDLKDLLGRYSEEEKKNGFVKGRMSELKEEYDLWEDKIWQYI